MVSAGDHIARWLDAGGHALLDAFFAESPDVIAVLDRELIIRYMNWAAGAAVPTDFIGQSALSVLRADHLETARDAYAAALQLGRRARFEMVYQYEGKVEIWEVKVGPIRSDGAIVGVIVLCSDITGQRQESADRDRFFSLSLDMLAVADANGSFKRLNPAFSRTLGHAPEELVGAPVAPLTHPDDLERSREALGHLFRGAGVADFESRLRKSDGQYRTLAWRATLDPITKDIYAVARDVTEQRSVEAQLAQAQKMEAVGQLAGGIAHDFNNLLLAIVANAELASQLAPPASELGEYLGDIRAAAERAAKLTRQLLVLSRRQPLSLASVNLNDLTQGLLKLLRRLLPESIAIEWKPTSELLPVWGDPAQLEQVLVNLCVNARDAMEGGGVLRIETSELVLDGRVQRWVKPGHYVLWTVSDTGVGMTAEVRERAFEPFFTTKGPLEGTGLGLSTVYGIVRQHDGMIQVDTEVGRGTRFDVYLPASVRRRSAPGESEGPSAPGALGVTPPAAATILLAEDEAQVRRPVRRILERAGYRVLSAADGHEALRIVEGEGVSIHLALLDIVMPGLGGPELWARIERLVPGLPVVFSTGYAGERYRRDLPAGARVLEKPFRPEQLLACVREALARAARSPH